MQLTRLFGAIVIFSSRSSSIVSISSSVCRCWNVHLMVVMFLNFAAILIEIILLLLGRCILSHSSDSWLSLFALWMLCYVSLSSVDVSPSAVHRAPANHIDIPYLPVYIYNTLVHVIIILSLPWYNNCHSPCRAYQWLTLFAFSPSFPFSYSSFFGLT